MGIIAPLTYPPYTGGGSAIDVPGRYPVAIGGRAFMIDTGSGDFEHKTIPLLRDQADQAERPSEASLNPAGLWRRSQETWHKGAGQEFFDRPESDGARFRSSKGVDVFTKWQLSLLKDTTELVNSANTNLHLAPTSTRLFLLDGTATKYTDDLSSVSTMTGTPAGGFKSITTDGYYVYATDGADIYRWVRTATATGAAWNTQDVDLLVWLRGKARLMAALNTGSTRSVFNITGAGAPTDIAPSTISEDFTWVSFAEGPSVIYGAGYQGDKSMIFRWGIKADGTGLDAAVPAMADGVPDGEIVRSIYGYAGFVLIGTDQGFRFALPDSNGDLNVGALVDLGTPVRCFEGQRQYVYFGWDDFDSTSAGLGRLDPTVLNASAPAYASDLMAAETGDVIAVATFLDRRVFSVSAAGIYVEHATQLVSSGTIDCGLITYGIPESKIAMFLDVRHEALDGSHAASISVGGGSFASLGTHDIADSLGDEFSTQERRGETFEIRHTLTREGSDTSLGPVITRHTLKVIPTAKKARLFVVPLVISDWQSLGGSNTYRDALDDVEFIEALWSDQAPIVYQEGSRSFSVTVEDYTWRPRQQEPTDTKDWLGTLTVALKETVT